MTEGKYEAQTPEMWKNGDWLLQHDNAPAHTHSVIWNFYCEVLR